MTNVAPRAGAPHSPSSATRAVALSRSSGESLVLDLINTETLDRGRRRDALSSPDALARWWGEACQRYPDQCLLGGVGEPPAWTGELLDAITSLRMALRALATQVVEQLAVKEEDLKPVNAILALSHAALEGTEQGNVKAVMRLHDLEKGSVVVPIAHSALQLLTEFDWRRLHQCKHDHCIVFFYDTTKSGTRRWCSPGCMNRARSSYRYQLIKKAASQQ